MRTLTRDDVRGFAARCAPFRGAHTRAALWQLGSTAAAFLAVVWIILTIAEKHTLLALSLTPLSGLLLVRLFIIQHDCGHGSFFHSPLWNNSAGRAVSLFTATPYDAWRKEHNVHHATSSHLETRGIGDINVLTVSEYRALPCTEKVRYRIMRNPLFLIGFGGPFYFIVLCRLPWFRGLSAKEVGKSTLLLDVSLTVFYGFTIAVWGWFAALLAFGLTAYVASAIGVWLFYVQHQFEYTNWYHTKEWHPKVSAVAGSSYYALPRWLAWFTGDIGIHHIHHLNSAIPNYKLRACLNAIPELKEVNKITFWKSIQFARLALWDEEKQRLVPFP